MRRRETVFETGVRVDFSHRRALSPWSNAKGALHSQHFARPAHGSCSHARAGVAHLLTVPSAPVLLHAGSSRARCGGRRMTSRGRTGTNTRDACNQIPPRRFTARIVRTGGRRGNAMHLSLKWQIALAMLLIAGLFVSVLGLNQARFAESLEDQSLLARAREVTQRAVDLERRGRNYVSVAPRNFRDYNRDLRVFYGDLQADLKGLADAVAAVAERQPGDADPRRQAIDALVASHAAFSRGLSEKLGDKPEEPRLEWAAEFLAAESEKLRAAAEDTEREIFRVSEMHLASAQALTRASWLLGLSALALVSLWFWRRVTRRVGRAAEQCQHVAEGEFGMRIEDDSRDEIGAFVRGFNALSSRTRVVLGVLDKLPADAGPERAFDTLWLESRAYLGHRWQALLQLDAVGASGALRACEQDAGLRVGQVGEHYPLQGLLKLAVREGDCGLLSDVRRHTLDHTQGKLLRDLSRADLRTLAVVLLRDDSGRPHSVLAFAWSEARAEEAGVARFLAGLTRFLTRSLVDRPASIAHQS